MAPNQQMILPIRTVVRRTTGAQKPCLFCQHKPSQSKRSLQSNANHPAIPRPIPFCPDVPTFLSLIGRGLSKEASKIPSWEALFSLTSKQLKAVGIEPARNRRYLLRWREKYRQGEFGIGGDIKLVERASTEIKDEAEGSVAESTEDQGADQIGMGRAVMKICQIPISKSTTSSPYMLRQNPPATVNRTPGTKRAIINFPSLRSAISHDGELPSSRLKIPKEPPMGFHRTGASSIYGPHVEWVKGTNNKVAVLKIREGLWEHRRGHKVDGGERRKAEVRFKRRAAERRAARD